ncbi:MAG: hypothetical protein IJJ73_03870 [Bacteroidaceae bacterium]|nr:hypothetical protein [Bacteroidaceae bacterium]
MKDQELYDIFHSYHPEMSSEEDFMAKLEEKMKAPSLLPLWGSASIPPPNSIQSTPPKGERGGGRLRLRLFLPWLSGIAAVIAVGLFLFMPSKTNCPEEADIYPAHQDYQAMLSMTQSFPTFEETVREIEQSGQQLQMAIAEMKE